MKKIVYNIVQCNFIAIYMTMSKLKKPDNIKLTSQQVEELKLNISSSTLSADDQDLLVGLMSSCLWLQSKLSASTITIAQLKKLFGVITTEKKSLDLLMNLVMSQ